MDKKIFLILGLSLLSIWAYSENSGQTDQLSSESKKLVEMSKAGVDEQVLLTYVRTSEVSFDITAEDVLTLKALGVPQTVITEAIQRDFLLKKDSKVLKNTVTENQLFRYYFGRIVYEGKIYSAETGLDPFIEKTLLKDPATENDLKSYSNYKTASNILSWGGFGVVLASAIYGGVTATQKNNSGVNSAIALSGVGTGVLMCLFGVTTDIFAHQKLYNGLYQYNQDLINDNFKR